MAFPPYQQPPFPVPPRQPAPRPKKRKIGLIIGVSAVVGAVAVAGFALGAPSIVSSLVVSRAASMGIKLMPGELSLDTSSITLSKPRFGLVGTEVFSATADKIVIKLSGLSPESIAITNLRGALIGSTGTVLSGLSTWQQGADGGDPLPSLSAPGALLTWHDNASVAPWASVTGDVAASRSSGTFHVKQLIALGQTTSTLTLGWVSTTSGLTLAPNANAAEATVQLVLAKGGSSPTAKIVAKQAPLAQFGAALPAILKAATINGEMNLQFAKTGAITGTLDASLRGYSLPIPRELGGLISAETKVTGQISADPSAAVTNINPLKLSSGSLSVSGPATLRNEPGRSVFSAQLQGATPCAGMATAVANNSLGSMLGGLVGAVANTALNGNINLALTINADTSKLAAATITPSFSTNCGLNLTLP